MSLLQPAHEYCDLCLGQRPVLGSRELPGGIFEFDRASRLGLLVGAHLGFQLPDALLVLIALHREQPCLREDRKSTRLNSQSLMRISYAVFCLKKKNTNEKYIDEIIQSINE